MSTTYSYKEHFYPWHVGQITGYSFIHRFGDCLPIKIPSPPETAGDMDDSIATQKPYDVTSMAMFTSWNVS